MSIALQIEEYHRPPDMDQAVDLLKKYGNKAQVIAGGTDILPRRQGDKKNSHISHLIDISNLELNYIKKNKACICIGAGTSINSIAESPIFHSKPYIVLAEAAKSHSTYTLRNRATIGGNLCNASPCADLALPLLVLDAFLVVAGANGKRNIPLTSFFKGANLTALKPEEMLQEIVIPIKSDMAGASFFKLRRHNTAIDMAVVNVATLLAFEKGCCMVARIAIGSAGPVSYRAKEAEDMLLEQRLTKDIIRATAGNAAKTSAPIDDIRATASYRKDMVAVLVQNSLEKSLQRSQG